MYKHALKALVAMAAIGLMSIWIVWPSIEANQRIEDLGPQPKRQQDLSSDSIWGNVNGTTERSFSVRLKTGACLGGIEYHYLSMTYMGGLTPRYVDGKVVPCATFRHPDITSTFSFYRICHEGHLYYQYNVFKGGMASIALNTDGQPIECDFSGSASNARTQR